MAGKLAPGDWARILDRLVEARLLHVTVSGGEPFTRPDMDSILSEIVSRPLRLSVNTNATLVGSREAAMLASLRPRLDSVMVSLDGPDAETHDRLRGPGAFDAALEGVRCLLAEGIRPGFCCTVSTLNAGSLAGVVDLALELGDWIILNPFLASGPCLPAGLSLDPRAFRESCDAALELSELGNGRVRGALVEMAAAARAFRSGRTGGAGARRKGRSCGGCAGLVAVLPDGGVAPCDHLVSLRLGSLLDTPLSAIMESSAARAFRARVEAPIVECPECRDCSYLDACSGGCPVIPWDFPGPLGPDPLSCLKMYFEASPFGESAGP